MYLERLDFVPCALTGFFSSCIGIFPARFVQIAGQIVFLVTLDLRRCAGIPSAPMLDLPASGAEQGRRHLSQPEEFTPGTLL